MRVFGYVRVSTIEQESGHGPEVQEAAIRSYAEGRKLGPLEIVRESASAESIAGRKEFVRLLAEAKELSQAGEEVHLIFRSSDRLARALMDQESVVATSMTVGFRLHSTLTHEAELFDPVHAGDPMRTAIRQFFGIFNQLDKAIIQSRLDGGLYTKASKGGSTGGRYPFGYHSVNDEIAPCPLEVPAVARAFMLSDQGLDLASIAGVLASEFPDVCGHWSKSMVKRVLDRADLYRHGMYRSRLSPTAMKRPDLIIAAPGMSVPPAPAPTTIDWSRMPDPVNANALALLVRKPLSWVSNQAVQMSVRATWRGQTMLLPRSSAQQIAGAALAG